MVVGLCPAPGTELWTPCRLLGEGTSSSPGKQLSVGSWRRWPPEEPSHGWEPGAARGLLTSGRNVLVVLWSLACDALGLEAEVAMGARLPLGELGLVPAFSPRSPLYVLGQISVTPGGQQGWCPGSWCDGTGFMGKAPAVAREEPAAGAGR